MVPYKRMPLIVEAFRQLPEYRLVVIGDGPELPKVRAAAGENVTVVGHLARTGLRAWLRGAQGFVFAADEDFGILPVEAMACGTPVVAYGRGGALETVVGLGDVTGAPATGVFFGEQSPKAIADAVRALVRSVGSGSITATACRAQAERFSPAVFRAGVRAELAGLGVPIG